jgi:hypothetical protein
MAIQPNKLCDLCDSATPECTRITFDPPHTWEEGAAIEVCDRCLERAGHGACGSPREWLLAAIRAAGNMYGRGMLPKYGGLLDPQ